jgi:hypothetical protein
MSISQPPFQSTLVDANDRVQTPWAQWFSQLQPILQSVVASGPTSGRPTQNLFIGYPYFDTTIDQMVYWNGVIWVTYAPSTTGTSILKGNGTGGFNNAVAGVDFAPATSGNAILYGNGAGGFSSVAIGSGVTFAGGVLSATGSGGTVTAVTGTAPIASSGGNTPAISISQAGASTNGYLSSIDWNTFNSKAPATSGTSILYGDGTGGFSNVTIGSGVTFVAGTLSATGSGGTVTAVTGSGNIASSGGTTPNITFTGTLPIANGGTGLSSFTANGIVYASSSSALATGAALTYDGSSVINGSAGSGVNSYGFNVSSSLIGATNNYGFYGNIASSTGRWNLYMNGTAGNYIAGALGIGTTSLTARRLVVAGSMTGATGAYGALVSLTIQPDVTGSAIVTASQAATAANGGTPYTIATLTCFNAAQVAFNADSTVTSQYGFSAAASIIGATNNYGFFGNIASAAGRWNLYMNGTAANYLAGNLLLGTTTQPTTSNNIVVAGLKATSAAAPTIASATTIAPTKAITFISGVTPIVTITAPNPISLGGGTITLIPTGIFTTTTAGNIALASTAVVGKALLMTYDVTTTKWYPSY